MKSLTSIVPPLIYLDANFIIYAFEGSIACGDKVRGVLRDLDSDVYRALTSELTLAEVLVKPLRDGNQSLDQLYRSNVATSKRLTVTPISRDILVESARLRAEAPSLKLPDAIHAATALLAGCTTFLTNDRRFEAVAGLPVLLLSAMK